MYKPTIGLEIHAELLTDSKLFCGCPNDPNSNTPNINICPICLGYPGAMPYLNKKALEKMIKIGLALNGNIADYTEFDRKHYFYPDIPKGYQISQYLFPVVSDAVLVNIPIERIHLEEDTAKSSHTELTKETTIDFNRSGVPLMELVTKPVIKDAEEANNFAKTLQTTLRHLGVAKARMEWGEMRVEANISISKTDKFGTKVEIKNLNSFKAVKNAIEYEIKRQTEVLDKGGVVKQETRGFDENSGKTILQRAKETSAEYRYMSEPDLPKYSLKEIFDIDEIKKDIPESLEQKKIKYTEEYSIDKRRADALINNLEINNLFEDGVKLLKNKKSIKTLSNYITTDLLAVDNFEKITAKNLADIVNMIENSELSSRGAKDTIGILLSKGGVARDVAEKNNLIQKSNKEEIKNIVLNVVKNNKKVVDEYREGNERSIQFLVGQVMKESKGSANPSLALEILKEVLK